MTDGEAAGSDRNVGASALEERRQTVYISVALFLFTFAVYWFVGPQETPYAHQVSQANNILHGHLDFLPEYSKNLNTLERVMFDGERFCFQPGDPEAAKVSGAHFSSDCKIYMQHSLGPAFLVLPGVAIWGNDLNQTLVSAIFGAMTAPILFAIARRFSSRLSNQLVFTALMLFGTVFWWVASNGGVWFFAHTTAVFFLSGAIYFTISRPNPYMAGLLFGAAFLCRPTVLLTGLFFVVMFSPTWLRAEGERLVDRINWRTVADFATGFAPLFLLMLLVNYLRFGDPTETGYGYTEQLYQDHLQSVYPHGLFDISYVTRHPPVFLEQMPIFQQDAPYVLPSWAGMAIWATTPAFFYSFFPNLKEHRAAWIAGASALGISAFIILTRSISRAWDGGWSTTDIPLGIHLLPFWVMTGVAAVAGLLPLLRKTGEWDRLAVACWAAIIPTAFLIFTFAATGWAQFGYRYALDFTPFLWLLVLHTIRDDMRWHHLALIGTGILVNAMGVLWVYQFEPAHTSGWTWVKF